MTASASIRSLGWLGVFRLGLVQTALGAIVVLTTSTLNRVMIVELALPAMLPGALVGWHYAVQISRPRWGYGADLGGARAPWILGGVAVLGLGAIIAAAATALMAQNAFAGVALAIAAFFAIGLGVGAAGTNLLAMLATHTAPERKAAAAAIVWIMMIFGFVLTAGVAGQMLDPFSMARLVAVTAGVSVIAVMVTALALFRLERRGLSVERAKPKTPAGSFKTALREIWGERQARRFTIFVFVSMLAYSAQDLILEPFAGLLFSYTPGESTKLAGVQNGGVLIGMIATAVIAAGIGKSRAGFMRVWTACGCVASAASLFALSIGATIGVGWPLDINVFLLGLSNGAFAVAAIGSMMALASVGRESREGLRMGVWGAAQAIAFGLGGFLGAAAIDVARAVMGETSSAFAFVFGFEAVVFLTAAYLAMRVEPSEADSISLPALPAGEPLAAE